MKTVLLTAFAISFASSAFADCKVDKSQYEALQDGMTYAEAVNVLGCEGEEMSSSNIAGTKTVMLMWWGNSMGANMNAMFQDDSLVMKAQFGLRWRYYI